MNMKMKIFPENSVDYAVKILSLTYYSPFQDTKKHVIIKYFLGACNLLLTALVAFDLIETGFSKHITKFAEKFEWFALLTQVSNDQVLHLVLFRVAFKDLLIKRKQFRKESDTDTKLLCNLNPFMLHLHLYAFMCFVAVLFAIVVSFNSNELVIPMWYPKQYPSLHNFLVYSQCIWTAFLGVFEYSGLCFFNALCQEVALQFKLINRVTEKVLRNYVAKKNDEGDICLELKEIVRYHQFLLGYTYELSRAISLRLLIMVVTVVFIVCMELYTISSASTTAQMCRCFLFLLVVLWQFTLFCFVTHDVTDQAADIARVAYNSKWYLSNSTQLKFFVRMLIMRGNNELHITAGNMVVMRRNVVSKIFKTALSYYTVLKSMEK